MDWLAVSFRKQGSVKTLQKLIVTSAVYRQSSLAHSSTPRLDNRFLWRMNRSRWTPSRSVTSVLSFTGMLDLKMGGLPVKQFHFEDLTLASRRKSITRDSTWTARKAVGGVCIAGYSGRCPILYGLDGLSGLVPTRAARNSSVTVLQALAMLNNPFIVRQAEHFRLRLRRMSGDLNSQIEQAHELAFAENRPRRKSSERRAPQTTDWRTSAA